MRELIGSEISVFLKKDDFSSSYACCDILGTLIDISDNTLYVQGFNKSDPRIFVIPRENVIYCTVSNTIDDEQNVVEKPDTIPVQPKKEEKIIDKLDVYINKQVVANIPIPPTFPVEKWSDKIMRVIMGNPEVNNALAGKIQKDLKYYPGEVYITVVDIVPPSQMPEQEQDQNSFSMGGAATTEFLNPIQMAQRLNNVGNGGKGDADPNM